MEAGSLNHWTARETLALQIFLILLFLIIKMMHTHCRKLEKHNKMDMKERSLINITCSDKHC